MRYKKSKKFPLFLVVLGTVILGVLFFKQKAQVSAWFDENWFYRNTLTYSNSGSAINAERKLKFDIDTATLITAGKMQADCDDVRFTDKNGAQLEFFIDTNTADCNNASTDFYVKVPSVLAGAQALYFYYGNPSAVSVKKADFFAEGTTGVGLKGYWPMDEAGANTCTGGVNDTCDYAMTNDGAWNGNAASTTGKVGSAITLDGTGDYVDLGNSSDVNLTTFSIAGWFNTSKVSNYNSIITKNVNSANRNYWVTIWPSTDALHSTGSLVFRTSSGTNVDIDIATTENFADSAWHHFTVTLEPGVAAYIYVDGTLRATRLIPLTPDQANVSALIGNEISNPGREFSGKLDDLRIYKKVLTSTEVSSVYNSGNGTAIAVPLTFSPTTGPTAGTEEKSEAPVAYWKFDEGYGTTTNDSSSNNNDGTITGATWQNEDMCVSGKCLYFDGTNDYTNTTTSLDLSGTNKITISFWLNWPTYANDDKIALEFSENFNSVGDGFVVGPNHADGSFAFCLNGTSYNCSNITRPSANTWHHYEVVMDTSNAASGEIVPYVDGKAISYTKQYSANNTNNFGNRTLYIMSRGGSSLFAKGKMDDLKIYSYVRTAGQIRADYNAGKAHAATANGTTASFSGDQSNSGALNDGLVGYWKLDEAATPSLDSSGNGNSGTWTNNTYGAGKFGNAASFDGVDDFINVADNNSLDVTAVTLSVWFKKSRNGSYERILYKNNNSGQQLVWGLQTSTTNIVQMSIGNAASNSNYYTEGTTAITDTNWHHYVATYDPVTSKAKLYVDGKLETDAVPGSTGNNSGTLWSGNLEASSGSLGIGKLIFAGTGYFGKGDIDETRIYNRALSPAEVRQLYEFAPGPVAYWNMDEDTGQYTQDISGNANTGTLGTGATADASDPTWSTGKYGKAIKFDGTNDYVKTGLVFNSTTNITMTTWVKWNGTSQVAAILYNGLSGSNGYGLFIGNGTCGPGNEVNVLLGGNACDAVNSSYTMPINGWVHLALTRDSTTWNLYVNGQLRHSGTTNPNVPTTGTGIGADYNGAGGGFNGSIDDVKIYNYARTQKQILEDMNGGKPANKSPIAHYKFDEGQGTVANNAGIGGSALNGTLTSMASPATNVSGWSNDGKVGKGLNFVNSNVNMPLVITNTTDLTMSLWVRPTKSQIASMIYNGLGGINGYGLYMGNGSGTAGTKVQLYLHGQTGDAIGTNTVDLPLNEWSHLTLTRVNTTWKLYYNGKLYDTATTNPNTPTTGTYIGAVNASNVEAFSGAIDEVKIFNFALSEDEVRQEFNQGAQTVLGSKKTDASVLAYDTFSTAGATSTESPSLPWTGSTWTVSGGSVSNSPTVGSEMWNSDPAAFTSGTYDWTAYGTNTIENDANALKITYGNTTWGAYTYTRTPTQLSVNGSLGNWYQYFVEMKVNTGSSVNTVVNDGVGNVMSPNITSTTFTNTPITFRSKNSGYAASHIAAANMGAGEIVWFDNLSLKQVTTSSLFRTVNTSASDVIAESDITRTTGSQVGLVLNLDSTSNPQNFAIAYLTNETNSATSIYLDKVVAGVYTNLTSGSVTYVAGAKLQVVKQGTAYSVYYNGTQVGTTQTVSDLGIIGNTKHGLFSTYSGNTFDNFQLKAQPKDTTYCVPGGTDYCGAPVAEWKFDEDTGTSANDTSGIGNNLSFANGPTWSNGKVGKSIYFDGIDDYIYKDILNGNMSPRNITLSAFIKTTRSGSTQGIIGRYDNHGTWNYRLTTNSTGKVIFQIGENQVWSTSLTSNLSVNDGVYHHINASYDGVSMRIFIDGILDNSISETRSLSSDGYSIMIGTVGVNSSTPKYDIDNYFSGNIDQVKIYNYARTPAQIAWDYNKGGPVAWYKFDECQGTTAYDASGNSNNGTISIGATGTNTAVGTCTGSTGEAWKDGASGKLNSSLEFDGTDDYVSVVDSSILKPTGNFSISGWFKVPSSAIQRQIFSSYSQNTNVAGIILGIDVDSSTPGQHKLGLLSGKNTGSTDNTDYKYLYSTANVDDNLWHFGVGTWDGSRLNIYVDGVLQNSVAWANAPAYAATNYVNLGVHQTAPSSKTGYMNGQIDNVKVFNYALTTEQVKTEFNGGAIKFGN